ncbi:hypothetical protein DFH09DRAFT_1077339 [Mycena vulgaris]|nr:hypothetical protein DFH09DRAFT_1077339 [Mycena vulgaris]
MGGGGRDSFILVEVTGGLLLSKPLLQALSDVELDVGRDRAAECHIEGGELLAGAKCAAVWVDVSRGEKGRKGETTEEGEAWPTQGLEFQGRISGLALPGAPTLPSISLASHPKGRRKLEKLRVLGIDRKSAHIPGRPILQKVTLTQQGVDDCRRDEERRLHMDHRTPRRLRPPPNARRDDDFHTGDIPDAPSMVNMADILDGSARIEIAMPAGNLPRWNKTSRRLRGKKALRRRQCVPHSNASDDGQKCRLGRPRKKRDQRVEEIYELTVVDMFATVAVKIRVLEAYHITHVRCPQLAVLGLREVAL